MFCTNCGAHIPDDKLFCTECGAPTGNNSVSDNQEIDCHKTDHGVGGKADSKTRVLRIAVLAIVAALIVCAGLVFVGSMEITSGETAQEEQSAEKNGRVHSTDRNSDSETTDATEPAENVNDVVKKDADAMSSAKESNPPEGETESEASTDEGQIERVQRDGSEILGTSQTTINQMVRRYLDSGHEYPTEVFSRCGASSIEAFCQIIFEEASAEGVRAEVVFAQSMLMTGWLQYGGIVHAEQCNFAGLGIEAGGSGADFSIYGEESVRMGIRAQVQHLKAYASDIKLVNDCVDPQFTLVERGSAPSVYDLAGRWASDNELGSKIMSGIESLLAA